MENVEARKKKAGEQEGFVEVGLLFGTEPRAEGLGMGMVQVAMLVEFLSGVQHTIDMAGKLELGFGMLQLDFGSWDTETIEEVAVA